MPKVYAVTVDATISTNEVWPIVQTLCNDASNVEGDQTDLGTAWEVWCATTDEATARRIKDEIQSAGVPEGYVAIEEVEV